MMIAFFAFLAFSSIFFPSLVLHASFIFASVGGPAPVTLSLASLLVLVDHQEAVVVVGPASLADTLVLPAGLTWVVTLEYR